MKTPSSKKSRFLFLALAVALLLPTAWARVEFALHDFAVSEFRDFSDVQQECSAPAASSFWCDEAGTTLTRIPTKGADYFFNEAGELLAVYAKQQKGQNLGSYSIDSGQNLIPDDARFPGGALLADGEYLEVEDAQASWQRVDDTEFEGRFTYRAGDLQVERVVRVSNITHTLKVAVRAERLEQSDDSQMLQFAFDGIARQDEPTIKIGQSTTFTANPVSQSVPDVSYASLQTNNRNSGYAVVMRPAGTGERSLLSLDEATQSASNEAAVDLAAQALPGGVVAMQRPLPGEPGSEAQLALDVYTGPNELVRYTQEGYADLPGLFNANILGRMSLGIIWVLRYIHEYVGSWGLSIIVLTLLFRVLIWPLIATQTKSMFGMQQLQPKIQALQKKYKDDKEKLTQETMKLYREAGVNPAGGCLPILLQMPLFIILWRVFVNFEFNEGFVWIPDLGQADPFYILPALYVGVMVAQSYFATRGNQSQFRQQLFINVVFVFIMVGFPAGVILYFVVSMLVQVIQYWLLSRNRPAAVPVKKSKG
ncbi:MAG: YidC/Oxa1 family membrane protein insertase [Trueperaceae bacterium]